MVERKTIGLWGVVFTIVGFVVGVSIFILPAQLVIIAGPAILISYSLAGAMAVVTCFATAQIGTLMPVEGGSFVAITRLLSPFWGFLAIWTILASVVLVNAFIGYGFADYFVYFVPGINKTVFAVCVILFFGGVNIFGSGFVVKFQAVMVIAFLVVIAMFLVAGVPHFDSANLTPFIPNGFDSVILAATIGYFSFGGFIALLEFGGEIKKPTINIPLGLIISFIIVILSYGGISLVLIGVDTGIDYQAVATPVIEVAKLILPDWVVTAMAFAIIAAAATTVNGLILGYSRDIFAVAKSKLFPEFLTIRSKRFGTPIYAIMAYTLLSVIAVLMGSGIGQYALVAVLGLLLQQIFIAMSLFRVPHVFGNAYENAAFKLSKPVLYTTAILLFVISMSFIVLNIVREPIFGVFIAGLLGVGSFYYYVMVRHVLPVARTKEEKNNHDL